MRKFLLIFTALLCSLLPSWAAEASYKIAFNTSSTSDLNETSLMKAVTEGKEYINSFTYIAKVYGGGTDKGIRLATGSAEGKFSIKLSAAGKQKITRIVVNAKVYNVSDGGTLKIGGTTSGDASISSTTFTDYEFKGDTNFAWENLNFSVPKSKRIYLKSITVYYESDGPVTEKSAKPEISGAASFTDNTEITITAASGASIYYTTDNTDPTTSSTQYSAPFTISETTTVKAIAVETGKDPSEVATATFTKKMEGDYVLVTSLDDLDEASSYIIGVQAKNAAMSNEKVSGKLKQTSVTIAGDVLTPTDNVMTFHLVKNTSGNWAFKADNYAGGESYYIQNSTSTDCKMDSLAYYFPVTLDNNNNIIIKSSEGRWIHGYNTETTADFRNYSKKENNSSEVQLYRLGSKVLQKPVITLSDNEVYVGEKVTVTIDKKNAEKVYYTTDGTTPSATNGNEYAAPFEVTAEAEGTITVQAIGIAEGMEPTAVVSATITVSKKEPIPDGSWVVVEKASELEVGARYVIAYNGYAVSNAAIASNKLQSTPATVTGGKLGFTDDMMVFTLGNGNADGKYTLKSNNYNNSTADSYLNFPKTNDADVAMASEPQELLINYTAGSSDVAIQLASGNRMLKGYNGTVFGYYSSTQSSYHNVQLYKEVDTRVACAAPTVTITPSEVIEGENATVSISGIESGATVRYTTDGTLPTATRGTVYAGEFTLSALAANTTVKAIAYADGKKNSEVAEVTVTVVLKPRMPEVTWKIGETTYTAANDGTYEVPAGTVLNIKAVNGDKIKVTNLETEQSEVRESPNTLTVNSDIMVSFASVNSEKNLESEALSAIFTRLKVVPSTPVVTWTLDGVNHTAENDSTYNVYAGTQVTVTSENADKIVVTDSESSNGEYNAPYTFTVTADEMFTFAGKNADGTSSEITVMYTVVERPAENVYTLITDASQLKAGNKYVIAVKEQNMALSNQGNWNEGNNQYRKAVDGTQANAKFRIDENNVLHDQTFGTSSKEGIMVFTLGGSAGKWTLKADNYILSTAEPREGELETGEWVKLYVIYVTDKTQPFFAMTTKPSENTISIAADGSATITNSNSTGYVMKYMENTNRFGMSKVDNDYPLVQLYGCVPQTKPEMPVVTYTKTIDGENVATEDCGEYTAINGSKITVTSKNATRIDINGTKYAAVNGTYSFTTDVDRLYIIKGVNEANEESAEYTLQIYVDYEAATIPEMHTLSQKQKDRTDKSLWAPVKFTGDVFIRGHYMKNDEGGLSETLWVEDANANASAIYELGGEFQQPGHSIENGMMLKNFKVRSESYFNALEHNIMVLISWPEEVETDVQTYDFQNFLQQMEMAEEASANNVFKLQKFNGDITFAADGTATMTLKNGKTITVSNQLSFKGNGNKQSWSRTEGNGFNWLPGNEWLNGQTKQNTHLVGYVMPEGDGANLSYAVYPAQITDDPGNITGVDGVENDNDGVSVVDGMIKAPAGSCIFSISGANVKANQTLTGGVYVVVTPNGKVVKVLVK